MRDRATLASGPVCSPRNQHGIESRIGRCRLTPIFARWTIALLAVALLGAASAVREFDISIRDRRVEGSTSTLRVKRGDSVLLRWRADEAVSVHLHGYDLQANLSATSPLTLRFEATVAGRFPITAHEFGIAADRVAGPRKHRELTLLYLEVLPE